MNTNHEREIEKKIKDVNQQPLPASVDDMLHQGLVKGRRHLRRWDIVKHSGLSIVALFLIFVLSVNFIPGFNHLAGNVPGLEKIVKLVEYDQGLQDAVDNDYVQVIGESDTKQGITFTVDDLIIDKRRLVIFYSVESDEVEGKLGIRSAKLFNKEGEELTNYSLGHDRFSLEGNQGSSTLDFTWNQDQTFDDQLSLYVMFEPFDEEDPTKSQLLTKAYTVTFPIDPEKIKQSKVHELDQTVTIEKQSIYFEKLESFPTRQVLYLEYDEDNSMDILRLRDLTIENEQGETIADVSRVSMSPESDRKRIVSLTSNYFKDYDELVIAFSEAMAIDKQKNKVIVDLEKKELVAAPDDQLTLRSISKDNMFELEDTLAITFALHSESENDIFNSLELGRITDQSGNTYHSISQSSSGDQYSIYIEDREYQGPLTFEIYQYPSYINENIRIPVN